MERSVEYGEAIPNSSGKIMATSKDNKVIQMQRLKSLRSKELDRSYIEGHQSRPENLDWAETSAKLVSKRLPKEKW